MGIFQETIAGGLDYIRGAAGVDVIYKRGPLAIPLRAVKLRNVDEYGIEEETAAHQSSAQDFGIAVADLVAPNGLPITPAAGDIIEEPIRGKLNLWELAPPGDAPHRQYSDSGETQYRLHANLIGTPQAPPPRPEPHEPPAAA